MASYAHLDLRERRRLYQLIGTGRSARQAAAELGRHPSTIYRELKRNRHYDEEPMFRGYFPVTANEKAAVRRQRLGKLARFPDLRKYVIDRLEAAWSPEQIAGYLRRRNASGFRISHETICQHVYSPSGLAAGLARLLPTGRRKRRRRYARRARSMQIPLANTIGARPTEIGKRQDFGHWEGDLILFRQHHGKASLTSLVERRSRYVVLNRNPTHHSAGVVGGIERRLAPLPPSLRRSMTLDRGTEFAAYNALKTSLGVTSYFCQPSSPLAKRQRREQQRAYSALPTARHGYRANYR